MQGRARGRKGERKTYHIWQKRNVRHGIWNLFIECGKTPTRARARKGEAQGVLSYQKVKGIFDNPQMVVSSWSLDHACGPPSCGIICRKNVWDGIGFGAPGSAPKVSIPQFPLEKEQEVRLPAGLPEACDLAFRHQDRAG